MWRPRTRGGVEGRGEAGRECRARGDLITPPPSCAVCGLFLCDLLLAALVLQVLSRRNAEARLDDVDLGLFGFSRDV